MAENLFDLFRKQRQAEEESDRARADWMRDELELGKTNIPRPMKAFKNWKPKHPEISVPQEGSDVRGNP